MVGKAGLVVVVGFSVILGYLSLNMSRVSKNSIGVMSSYADGTLSHNLAMAGANIALAKCYADPTWFGDETQTFNGPHFYGSVNYYMEDLHNGTVRLRSMSTYKSPSTPVAETLSDTVEVFFKGKGPRSFSLFAWMTDSENQVNWTSNDIVWGRVHTNDTLYVKGAPVFWGKVTTSRLIYPAEGKKSNNKAVFKTTYETGVARIELPTDLGSIDNAAQHGGRKYSDSIWVTLSPGTTVNGDGRIYVRRLSYSGTIIDSINLGSSFNGVLACAGTIHLLGTLDGALSVCSITNNIIIEDDVIYEQDPLLTISDDVLGIIAERDVVVADNAANNNNCEIDGCIFTRTGSFRAENYARGPLFGELQVLGSIVQRKRGPVAYIHNLVIQKGFAKRYKYDDRLASENFRPPFFPGYVPRTLAITNWWESYRVPNINQ